MVNNKIIYGFIPCKLDSQRLPNKNLQSIHGKTLLRYAIDYLLSSKIIDKVWISTENPRLFKSDNVLIHHRPRSLCGETYLLDVYHNFASDYDFDYLVITTPDSLPKPMNLDEIIKDTVNRNLHEFFTVNQRMEKSSALNILSFQAVKNKMVAGYTKVKIIDTMDIQTQEDLEECQNNLRYIL